MAAPLVPLHRRLKVRHLELLAALQDEGSLHRVAWKLGMTQPAASKLLLEAEAAVEVRLFERSRQGVLPTASGAALGARARQLLAVLDGSRDELAAVEAGATGLVCAGVSAVAAAVLVPKAITLLRSQGSGIRVRIEEAGAGPLLELLRAGKLDCVLGRALDNDDLSDLAVESLYHQPIVIVARPGHPLLRRSGAPLRWPAALAFEWVLPPPHAPLRRMLASWLTELGLAEPRCGVESVSTLANITLLRESDSLAMLPGDMARHYERARLVKTLPLPFEVRLPAVSLLTRRGEPVGGSLRAFCDALRAVRPAARQP